MHGTRHHERLSHGGLDPTKALCFVVEEIHRTRVAAGPYLEEELAAVGGLYPRRRRRLGVDESCLQSKDLADGLGVALHV